MRTRNENIEVIKTALVITYAEISKDPRVRNQIKWLVDGGYIVDTLGRGPIKASNGKHFEVKRWPLPLRLFSYLFLPNQARFNFLMKFWIRKFFKENNKFGKHFDVILFNTIDYLPVLPFFRETLLSENGKIVLDLHEYSLSQGIGTLWKIMFRKYQNWLVTMISLPDISIRTTVSDGIAELYRDELKIPKPLTIYNVPPFRDLRVRQVNGNQIKLIHHGKADMARGLKLLLNAMTEVNDNFELSLMLVGSPTEQIALRAYSDKLGLKQKIQFIDPVAMDQVSARLNEFDAEIIFFPPETENLRFVLPNKYFEAVQGRIAIISGPSIEIIAASSKFSNAVFTKSWNSSELARVINSQDAESITSLKNGSKNAAKTYCAEAVGIQFLSAIKR
jgi:hypothetical protein